MISKTLLRSVCAVLTGAMLAACGSGSSPWDVTVTVKAENADDSRSESVQFLINRYHFKEEDLEGFDAEAFINDYKLREMDYTAEEVWEIFEDNRMYYLITETDGVFSLLAPTDEVPEKGSDLKADSDIVSIGFYENPGSLQRSVLFDLDGGIYYVDDAVPHELGGDDIASLKGICRETPVCSWKHLTTSESSGTTGSYAWKIVFLLRDGTKCVYGGWTDTDVLPKGYEQVTEIFNSCLD